MKEMKFKLGSDMYGWNYDKLVEMYPALGFSTLVSKETIHTNIDDETETEEIMVVTLFTINDLMLLKGLIEGSIDDKDAIRVDRYEGLRFDPPYSEEDLKEEVYNDIVIVD